MIDSPNENVHLTLEQLQQLDVFQTRLSGLQNELIVGNRELTAINNDTARISKEKEYQQSLLSEISAKVTEAEQKFNNLNAECLTLIETKNGLLAVMEEKTEELTAKEMSLKDREDDIALREQSVTELESKIDARYNTLKDEVESFNSKVSKLKEVLNLF